MEIRGRDIWAARNAASVTQSQLAKACRMSVHRLIDIERERVQPTVPSPEQIMKAIEKLAHMSKRARA